MPVLTGSLADVVGTQLVAAQVRQAFVKAPASRGSLASGDRLIVSAPVPVATSGTLSLELEPGPAVLVVDTYAGGPDVYDLYVTSDMTLLSDALAESAPERSWSESVMVQLRKEAVEAAEQAERAANEFGLTVTSSQVGPEVPSTATLSGDGPAYAIHLALSKGLQGDQGDPGEVTTATLNAALAGKADLTGGQVPTSQLPAIALTKPFPVADRAAMLALTAQEGDVAVITGGADKGTYMLSSGPSGTFGSWVKLTVPDAPVQSVNGQTGTVNLGASDVGASPTGHKHAVPADLITTGTPLSTTFLNGVGAWATPPDTDTTYAVMAEAEAATGTATTARAVSAAGLKGAIQRWATGSYATAISAIGQALNKAATAADARTAIGAGTSNLALGTTASTARAGNWVPTKSDVGLGSVDNTSDAAKPVSTLQQAAINAKVTNAGGASGMWLGTTATLPPTGTTGVLYVTY